MGEVSETLEQVRGTVKWFDPRKGFGFIVGPQNQDIFVHYTVIEGSGFRVLTDGAEVEYDAEKSDKGWRATRAIRVGGKAAADEGVEDSPDAPEVVVPKRTYSRTPRR